MRKAHIGTIIHGTLNQRDLIPELVEALRDFDPDHGLIFKLDEMDDEFETDDEFDEWVESLDAGDCLNDLFDALNEHAPSYCYFGAHEGDGSDFGFWISWDSINDATHNGELVKVNAGDPWPCVPEILEVNDHGNATLYVWSSEDHCHVEVWSVV